MAGAPFVFLNLLPAQSVYWDPAAGGNGHYYELVTAPGGLNWWEARQQAAKRGGRLATIGSAAENTFAHGLAAARTNAWMVDGSNNSLGPWLGGYQPDGSSEPAGGWQWISGEPFSYVNWSGSEPNNSGGTENALQFFGVGPANRAATWNDLNANSANPVAYISEVDLTSATGLLTRSAAGEFSATQNPNDVWTYGWTASAGTSFNPFTQPATIAGLQFWRNPAIADLSASYNPTAAPIQTTTPVFAAGKFHLHPGPAGQFAVLRFTSPVAGLYEFITSFEGADTVGTSTDVRITAGTNQWFQTNVNGYAAASARAYRTTVTLAAGAVVDFAVGPNGTHAFDTTRVDVQVRYQSSSDGVQGAIAYAGEIDPFSFRLATPSILYFDTLVAPGNLNWTLTGPAGTVVDARGLSSSDSDAVGDPLLRLPAGDYTLTVRGTGAGTNAYAFRMLDLADATLTQAGTTNQNLEFASRSTDLYQFTASAGDVMTFDMLFTANGNTPYWRLVDPYGSILWANYGADVNNYTLPASGRYVLMIEGRNLDTTASAYSYRLVAVGANPPPPFTGTALTLGTTVSNVIATAGATNAYTFSLDSRTMVYFDSLLANSNLRYTLLGPAGVMASTRGVSGGFTSDFHDLPAGNYQLILSAINSYTGPFTFRLLNLTAGRTITPGTVVVGSNQPASSLSVYQFTGTAGARLYLDVLSQSGFSYYGNCFWTLIDPFGNPLFSDATFSDRGTIPLTADGTYRLWVAGGDLEPGGVGFHSFNLVPAVDTAVALTLNTDYTGVIATPGQRNIYSFTLNAAKRIYFQSWTNQSLVRWTLKGPSGNVASSLPFNAGGWQSYDLDPGSYELTVFANGDNTGFYAFRIVDYAAVAAPLSLDTVINGTLSPASQVVVRELALTAGDRLFFDALSQSGFSYYGNLFWRLEYPEGDTVYLPDLNASFDRGFGDYGPFIVPRTATYRLLIGGSVLEPGPTGNYSFRILRITNSTETLTLGQNVQTILTTPTQQRVYTFSLPTPTTIAVDSLESVSNLRWTLAGAERVYANLIGFNAAGWQLYDLPAGPYTFTISASSDSIGTVSFRLQNLAVTEPMSIGTPVSLTLTPPRENRILQFAGQAGQRLYFDVLSQSGFTSYGYAFWILFAPGGDVLFDAGVGNRGPIDLPQTGNYTLMLSGHIGETLPSASVSFQLASAPQTTNALPLDTLVTGTIAAPGERDRYTFSVAQATPILFDSRTNSALRWTLTGPAGSIFGERTFANSDGPNYDSYASLPPGSYTLDVYGNVDETGGYGFLVRTLASAASLALNATVNGSLTPASATAIYQFAANAGDRVRFQALSLTAAPNLFWRLHDPAGDHVWTGYFSGSVNSNRLERTGTYTLQLEGQVADPGNGAFSFSTTTFSPVPPPGLSGPPFVLGQIVSNTLPTASTVHSYQLTLDNPTRIYLDYLLPLDGMSWAVTSSNGPVIPFHPSTSALIPPLESRRLAAGTYEFQFTGVTTPYAFRVLSVDAAPLYTLGTIVTNQLIPASGAALFRVNLLAGQTYYYDTVTESGFSGSPWKTLQAPAGVNEFLVTGFSDFGPFTPRESGTFLFALDGTWNSPAPTGTVAFALTPVSYSTNTLTFGATIEGTLAAGGGDIDSWTIHLPQPERVFFDVLSQPTHAWNWSIAGTDGDLVVNRTPDSSDGPDLGNSSVLLPAGSHVLQVKATGTQPAPYKFRVLRASDATPFAFDTVVNDVHLPASGTTLWRFTATAGQELYYDYLAHTGFGSVPALRLFSPAGNIIQSQSVNSDREALVLPMTGDYVLALEGRYQDANPAGTNAFNYRRVVHQTNSLTFDQVASASIDVPGVHHDWTFSLPSARLLWFDTLTNITGAKWSLRRGPVELISDRSFNSSDSIDISDAALRLAAGDYVLTVSLGLQNTGRYAFRLVSPAAATAFTAGSLVVTPMDLPAGTRLGAFAGTAGDRFFFDGQGTSGGGGSSTARFYSPSGNLLFSRYISDDEPSLTLPITGTYLLAIESRYIETADGRTTAFILVPNPPKSTVPLFEDSSLPDLVVPGVTVTPASGLKSGDGFTVNWTVRNDGALATGGAFSDRVIVRNTTLNQIILNSTLLYDPAQPGNGPLAPGSQRARQLPLTLPAGATGAGALEIAITTDTFNQIAEVNSGGTGEANNSRTTNVTAALAPYPDLQITGLRALPAANWSAGLAVQLSWTTTNTGPVATSTSWVDRVLVRNLSRSVVLLTTNVAHDQASDGPLPPGVARARSAQFQVPSGLDGQGEFEISVETDALAQVVEAQPDGSGETNNIAAIRLRSAPNLELAAVAVSPAPAQSGAQLLVQWTLRNSGNAPVETGFSDRVIIRPAGGGPATTLATTTVGYNPPSAGNGPIAPGTTRARSVSIQLPDGPAATGTLEVEVTADIYNQVFELTAVASGETDNTATSTFTSTLALYPDLRPANVSVTPASPQSGQEITVRWEDRNDGVAPAAVNWSDRIQILSAGSGTVLIETTLPFSPGTLGPLTNGTTRTRQQIVRLPNGLSGAGALRAVVTADFGGAVFEDNAAGTAESNNVASLDFTSTLAAYPDLAVHSYQVTPASFESGRQLTATWVLTNLGNGPVTGDFYDRVLVRNLTQATTLLNQSVYLNPVADPGGPIAPGTARTRTFAFRLPDGTAGAGSIDVALFVDDGNRLFEYRDGPDAEANNATNLVRNSSLALYPDLAVSSIVAPPSGLPGESITVSWTIVNSGAAATPEPWTDQVFLVDDANPGAAQLLASFPEGGTLAPAASTNITHSVSLPFFAVGSRRIAVRANVGPAFYEPNFTNNNASASSSLQLAPRLDLTLNRPSAPENAGTNAVVLTVVRNGHTDASLTVTLTNSDPATVTVPAAAVIPAGQSHLSVPVFLNDDTLVNGARAVHLDAAAPGYTASAADLTVLDDDNPELSLQLSVSSIVEDAGPNAVMVFLTRNTSTNGPLVVTLTSDNPSRLATPASVTIPAGSRSVAFGLTAPANAAIDGDSIVRLQATAAGHATASALVTVFDNDVPQLALVVAAPAVSEGAESPATTATLSRPTAQPFAQLVALTPTPGGLVLIPPQLTIPAGQASVSFNVNVSDDSLVNGPRQVQLLARPYAAGGVPITNGQAVANLTIYDNDGPTLTLTLANEVVSESGSIRGTVSRNTSTTASLVVTLASSDPGEARPAAPTVTIPAGQTSATFAIQGVPDGINDGIQATLITATAAGFNSANARLNVSDVDLPDLAVGDIIVPSSGQIDARANVTFTVANTGPVPAAGPWVDRVYISTDNQLGGDILAGAVTNSTPLAANSSYTRTVSVTLPADPARYHIIVITDADNQVTEGNERNNVISIATIDVQPNYRATVETDVTSAPCGTAIPIHGRAYNPDDNSPARLRVVTVRILNGGTRRLYNVFTDLDGLYQMTFTPLPTETGEYRLAADHPRVNEDTPQDTFSLLGFSVSAEAATMTIVPQTPISGDITLANATGVPLTGLAAAAPDAPASLGLQLSVPGTLDGHASVQLHWSINTTITNAARVVFPVTVTSAEGCKQRILFTVNIAPLRPQLVAEPAFLDRGMLRGTQTLVPFAVRNIGGVPSGLIDVLPPNVPWLTVAGTNQLDSLEPGASTVVNVLLEPPADLALGLYTGSIGLGNGRAALSVPFRFRAVSSAVGDLHITATDDYTYYVAGSPKLTNALVTITDPYGGLVITNGITDANGEVRFLNLPEGAYTVDVSASKHNSFRGTATIQAGTEAALEAFLTRQTVTYRWTVVPIEIEDRYKIVLESVFETDVPIPNVIVEEPYIMPLVIQGETNQFEIALRNEGLIAAENVELNVPNDPRYLIQPLVRKIGTIPAKSRLTIPVLISQRAAIAGGGQGGGDATGEPGFAPADGGCEIDTAPCLPKIGLGVAYYYTCGGNGVPQQRSIDLSPVCLARDAAACIEQVLQSAGSLHSLRNGGGNAANFACDLLAAILQCAGVNLSPCQSAALSIACGAATGGLAGAAGGAAGGNTLECICGYLQNLNISIPPAPPSYGSVNYTGGSIIGTLHNGFNGYPWGGGWYIGPGNCSTPSHAPAAGGGGGGGGTDGFRPADSGVCARVRLQISQDAVLTRVAFKGSLEIDNDSASALSGLRVTIDVRDADGQPAGDRFVVRPPVVSGFGNVDGTGSVAPSGSGSAEYLIIPTRDAAATAPALYRIGGSLRYLDGGQEVVVPLVSAPITVYPEARLQLHYFQTRDVFADDPFTDDIEPSEPFALGLLARNVGAGEARNFRITSAQPKIIENEKGLLIDFKIIGSQVGTDAVEPSLTVNLGNIPAGHSQVAQWLLTSSLQGKFIEYKATFEHVDNFGSTNLSLIDSVEIHELIRAVRADRPTDDAAPDFLANDIPDADHLPDTLYLSDGSSALVSPLTAGNFSNPIGAGQRQATLTFSAAPGWTYLQLPDPGPGWQLQRVVRSDNKSLRVGTNVWTTDRSFPSTQTGARREHLFHLLDFNSTGSYTVFYRPDDHVPPAIASVGPVTPSFQTAAVPSVDVVFSEEIDPATFTIADLTLSLDGGANRINGSVTITPVSTNRFTVGGLGALTAQDGNYTFSVIAAGVLDYGENPGQGSVGTSWAKGTIAPVVTGLGPVTPDPRNQPVDTVEVVFSRAIDEATFSREDITLTRDSGANLITSAVAVQALDTNRFLIANLGPLTRNAGTYRLTVAAGAVQDTAGNGGAGTRAITWSTLTTGPAIVSLEQPTTNPRNIVVASLDVTFAAPINGASFDWQDLRLTRDSGANLITSAVTVQPVNPTVYRIANFNWVVGQEGTYALTVNAAGIVDAAGNPGTGSATASWTMDTTRPATPTAIALNPDRGVSTNDALINTLTPTLSGTVAETNLTVRVKNLTTGVDYGPATTSGQRFTKALTFDTAGAHQLQIRAVDAAGNVSFPDVFLDVFVDLARPGAIIDPVTPALRNTAVDALTVTFSESINPATFTRSSLSLRRQNGANLINNAVQIAGLSTNQYRVSGLTGLTDTAGAYEFALDMATVEDRAGNSGSNRVAVTWSRTGANQPPTLAPIADRLAQVGTSIIFTNAATDPDAGQTLRYSLNAGAPGNARLGDTSGVFRWTPTRSQSPGIYPLTITVTDDGVPPASASRTFTVSVSEFTETTLGEAVLLAGEAGGVDVALISTAGLTNLQAEVAIPTNRLRQLTLGGVSPLVSAASLQALDATRYRVSLVSQPGQSIRGSNVLARLQFGTTSNQPSGFLPLPVSNITARQPDGTAVGTTFTRDGRVIVIADRPLLELVPATATSDLRLRLFARPGDAYDLESAGAATAATGAWSKLGRVRFTGREQSWLPTPNPAGMAFFRLVSVDVSAPFFELQEHDATGLDVIFYGPRGHTFDFETTPLLGAPWILYQTQPMTNAFQPLHLNVPPGGSRFLRARER